MDIAGVVKYTVNNKGLEDHQSISIYYRKNHEKVQLPFRYDKWISVDEVLRTD